MPASRTFHLILNGKHDPEDDVLSALQTLRAAGHTLHVRSTTHAGDAARYARHAVHDGVSTVVAGGGDGTLNEVVQGLMGASSDPSTLPSLGILPLGTANDFARAAGIPDTPRDALRLILERDPVPIDVGLIGERFFLNMATGGFGSEITTETPDELKKVLGQAAYALTGLTHLSAIKATWGRITGPSFQWEGEFLGLAVGNGRFAGGGHALCPDAMLNDGLFDVSLIPALPAETLADTIGALLKKGFSAIGDAAVHTRLPQVEIEVPDGLHMNLDGEPISGTHFTLEVHDVRLRVHLPYEAPIALEP